MNSLRGRTPSGLQRLVPDASPALCEILDPADGAVQPPIRSEIFGMQRFAQHGRSLGETHRAERAGPAGLAFFPRLPSNIAMLRQAHRYIASQASTGYDVSPAAEWLLDNFHLIEAQLEQIHDGLPRSYFRSLPMLVDEPLAGLPRIYGVAWAFVAHTDSAFDEDLLAQYLCAYQETRELNLSESWALPTTLRVVLIENLRRLAERVATHKAAREAANLCCDHLDACTVPALDELLALLERRGVARMFLAQVSLRLQDRRGSGPAPVHDWLALHLPDPAVAHAQHSADQTADNLSVSNAVTSLRAIGDADWPDIVSRTSTLMRLMRVSPVFEAEDAASRDQTLHAIEHLARRSGQGEVAVAKVLLGLMGGRVATDPDGEVGEADPGAATHWLQGAGRPALAQALGLHPRAAWAWRVWGARLVLPVYLSVAVLGSIGLVAWMLLAPHAPLSPGWLWLTALLMLVPASEAVVAVANRLVSESTRPRRLPRLALADGIPADHRVMVAIPAMLNHPSGVGDLARRLQLHYLANREPQAQFALLTDWTDADTAEGATDDELLALATRHVDELNQRHPRQGDEAGLAPRFVLLHRHRLFSDSEQRWIGWERKRGKLELLVAALAEGDAKAFLDLGEASRIAPGTRYVVTLDSDTQLPPGRLRELVGVAAHPCNQPRLDAAGRRVLAGYGILQPRLATPLPTGHQLTPFHWMFAGQCGIDPYSAASSEVYQDLFGEGSFTGKGLLQVAAVHSVLSGRLPEGQVLSHDLLEGSIARCATVSDLAVVEDAPFHADVAASRVHRWTRGDWQLLPFVFGGGDQGLSPMHRWKMLDNLRRSLVAPASLLLLWLALAGWSVSPGAALALVMAAYLAGPLMGAVAGFAPSRDDMALLHFYRLAALDLARTLCTGLWHLAMLLQQAAMSVDAIGRALYRMTISHRQLLQWTTAETAQAQALTDLGSILRAHWRAPLTAALMAAATVATGLPHQAMALALCALWAGTPVWIWWVSRRRPLRPDDALGDADRARLEGIARDTWRFFERCVGAEDRHLPPDNLQTLPHDMVAHRTSPTNIGLYLLSAACARRFGWIGTPQLLARLEATLATLATLQRHRGHFLNWYDTRTGAPLLPMYVSTVDSGNLSGHLLAVAQACREQARAPMADEGPGAEGLQARLWAVAQAAEDLAWAPDFAFLYDPRRRLLHIGYRVAEQQLDSGFYDLLASESRLTSLLAIAKGDVPVRHWASLGRPFYAVGAMAGLRSWSGSMFEYLMPSLVLDEPPGSALQDACCAALREQVAFTQEQGVPWGISESAYAGRDHTLAYQYAPQGVPRLALRRTPPDELVIAPYATALAAQVAARLACRNFEALQALGARGTMGFIEALDFTPARRVGDEPFTPVGTYMAHHQGMVIVALANVLLDGVARRWGMASAQVQAVSPLLHERPPREISMRSAPRSIPAPLALRRRAPGLWREVLPGQHAVEPTHLLSNGRFSTTLRANGAGASRWGALGLTRWRDDALRDAHGSFLYLRWQPQGTPVSLTQHPAPDANARYASVFHADRVVFEAAWPSLQARTTVWVSPEDDIEFRQVELHNLGDEPLSLEVISAFDVVLADARADEAHPAFSNLFVRASWQDEHQALVFERRPRLQHEQGMHLAHFLADRDPQVLGLRQQTDRQRWLGRNRAPDQPLASLDALPDGPTEPQDGAPSRPLDCGFDPVCALGAQLQLLPGGKAVLTFATAVSPQPGTLHAMIDKYRQPSHVQRASLMSATLAGIRLRAQRMTAENFAVVQTLTTALLLTLTRTPADGSPAITADDSGCDRRLLWRFGISGDRPIVLVSAGSVRGLGLLRTLAQALHLWSWGGVVCDLVVINDEPASYQMALQRELTLLAERHAADPGGHAGPAATAMHLLRGEDLSEAERSTLQRVARLRLQADGRPLPHHVQEWTARHEQAMDARQAGATTALRPMRAASVAVPAPRGSFSAGEGEFRFEVSRALRPVRPWVNVLANAGFGTQVSEAGGGCTWALNSRLHQLTAWSNDPVADPPGEWFLLQDRASREAWSLLPSAWGDPEAVYRVSHGQGYTVVRHRRGPVEVSLTWCVDAAVAVKQVQLRITHHGAHTVRLRLVGVAEWTMGAGRTDRATVHTAHHMAGLGGSASHVLLCTQRERGAGFGGATAFLALVGAGDASGDDEDWTCDRRECFDARGQPVLPDHFGQGRGDGLDPCAALATAVVLRPGESVERLFLLGHAASPDAARQLAATAIAVPAAERFARVRRHWDQLLGSTTVATPDPLFDAMVNRWLLYQTVACRLWAKAGFYQAGGATGFRDQLQDAMALAWAAPWMLRAQIVLAASRQFVEGDVQHWWHSPGGAGVRTHSSDDLLWLPVACAHYLRASGDTTLLDERVPFIEGRELPLGAEDAYDTPTLSGQVATVYEHAARTIDRSLRVGVHGLPLMGGGDWNDGMNRVGEAGRGESVWLGWFLHRLVADFAPLARGRGEPERAQRWEAAAVGWKAALNGAAWDGQWFKRAFFDDGQALGSHENQEARIDLIAQAWSVLSQAAPAALQRTAMAAVEVHLVDPQAGLLRLLDPPLAHAVPSAGYIQAYPPGVRENGGQYTHAGVWAMMAQAELVRRGEVPAIDADLVYRDFTWLCPAHRANHPTQGAIYGLEPYAVAGDVYSHAPHAGRGGWSWYTGAAAWLHRAALESVFGLKHGARVLSLEPCLPSHWPRAELTLRRDGRTLRFLLVRGATVEAIRARAPADAVLLSPGQPLAWTSLPEGSRFLVPLLDGARARPPDVSE
ncbi:GH36-type glycosyl hydrolase domain-containing protein [Ideonella sp. A 288]|uniref:GH36-type glycosyl hydrolase domain-containing protein n=1 Tax=Ideonella sp. A 288 TaxID=1962181 RepID=UPI000B4B0EA6